MSFDGRKAFADDWARRGVDAYVSKEYPDATEVLSMGIERLWKEGIVFYLRDKEHFLQTIKGLMNFYE